jgi:thioredoxin 1
MKEIQQNKFDAETKSGAAVADFFGSGCINCKMIEPALLSLEAENPNVKFIKIDTGKAAELVRKFGISTLPTLLFIKDGTVKQTLTGLKPRGILARAIDELV